MAHLRSLGALTPINEPIAVAFLAVASALDEQPVNAGLLREWTRLQERLEARAAAAQPVEDYGARVRRLAASRDDQWDAA